MIVKPPFKILHFVFRGSLIHGGTDRTCVECLTQRGSNSSSLYIINSPLPGYEPQTCNDLSTKLTRYQLSCPAGYFNLLKWFDLRHKLLNGWCGIEGLKNGRETGEWLIGSKNCGNIAVFGQEIAAWPKGQKNCVWLLSDLKGVLLCVRSTHT